MKLTRHRMEQPRRGHRRRGCARPRGRRPSVRLQGPGPGSRARGRGDPRGGRCRRPVPLPLHRSVSGRPWNRPSANGGQVQAGDLPELLIRPSGRFPRRTPKALDVAHRFLTWGGAANMDNLAALHGLGHCCGEDIAWEPPVAVPWEGLYHPDAPGGPFPGRHGVHGVVRRACPRKGAGRRALGRAAAGPPFLGQRQHRGRGRPDPRAGAERCCACSPPFSNSLKDLNLGNSGRAGVVPRGFPWPKEGRASRSWSSSCRSSWAAGGGSGEERAAEGGELFRELDAPVLQPRVHLGQDGGGVGTGPAGTGGRGQLGRGHARVSKGSSSLFCWAAAPGARTGPPARSWNGACPCPSGAPVLAQRVARWVALRRRRPLGNARWPSSCTTTPAPRWRPSVGGRFQARFAGERGQDPARHARGGLRRPSPRRRRGVDPDDHGPARPCPNSAGPRWTRSCARAARWPGCRWSATGSGTTPSRQRCAKDWTKPGAAPPARRKGRGPGGHGPRGGHPGHRGGVRQRGFLRPAQEGLRRSALRRPGVQDSP